jgi:Gamma-glutamyl cyclotransferase, AIG2-like
MRLFFFGSLMDADLLALVTGRAATDFSTALAVLHGFERRRAIGESFPIIVPHPGGRVDGVLVQDLTDADLARVQFFEGSDYALHPFTVDCAGERVEVQVFLPTARLEAEEATWDFEAWVETERAMCFALAEELMSHYGGLSIAEIDVLWPEMKTRARRRFRRFGRRAKRA